MRGHGLEQLVGRGRCQVEVLVHGFAGAHHLARVVDAEQAHHPLELLPGRGLVEVAEVLGFDALLAEQVARTSALRAVGVEVHEDVVLRIHGHEPKEARLRSRPGAAGA